MALNEKYTDIGYGIIGAAFEVRKTVGNGLREKFYMYALAWELRRKGYDVKIEAEVPACYKGYPISDSFFADIIVDNSVIIEVKALKRITESESRQLNTYLYLTGCKLGYLINFGVDNFTIGNLKNDPLPLNKGIYRMVNGIDSE